MPTPEAKEQPKHEPDTRAKLQNLRQAYEESLKNNATADVEDLANRLSYVEELEKKKELNEEEVNEIHEEYEQLPALEKAFAESDDPKEEPEEDAEEKSFMKKMSEAEGFDKVTVAIDKIGELLEKIGDFFSGMGSKALLSMVFVMEKMGMDSTWADYLKSIAGSEKAVLQGALKDNGIVLKKDKKTEPGAMKTLTEIFTAIQTESKNSNYTTKMFYEAAANALVKTGKKECTLEDFAKFAAEVKDSQIDVANKMPKAPKEQMTIIKNGNIFEIKKGAETKKMELKDNKILYNNQTWKMTSTFPGWSPVDQKITEITPIKSGNIVKIVLDPGITLGKETTLSETDIQAMLEKMDKKEKSTTRTYGYSFTLEPI